MRPPGGDALPQARIPAGAAPLLPVGQPVRPEHLIPLIGIGKTPRELPGLEAVVTGQIAADLGRPVRRRERRQQREQQRPLLGRRQRRQRVVLRAQHPPHERGREHAVEIRRHAQALRHRQGQPARHAGVRHHDGLRRQRRAERCGDHLAQAVGKAFEAVAVVDVEHGSPNGSGLRCAQKLRLCADATRTAPPAGAA
jgi:hypothetical protein